MGAEYCTSNHSIMKPKMLTNSILNNDNPPWAELRHPILRSAYWKKQINPSARLQVSQVGRCVCVFPKVN